jgi:mRNA interferase RelE/StbE
MPYAIVWSQQAQKDFDKLGTVTQDRIDVAVEGLRDEPRGSNTKALRVPQRSWRRLRVGDYRVIYTVDDRVRIVSILKVAHRRDVYRSL